MDAKKDSGDTTRRTELLIVYAAAPDPELARGGNFEYLYSLYLCTETHGTQLLKQLPQTPLSPPSSQWSQPVQPVPATSQHTYLSAGKPDQLSYEPLWSSSGWSSSTRRCLRHCQEPRDSRRCNSSCCSRLSVGSMDLCVSAISLPS